MPSPARQRVSLPKTRSPKSVPISAHESERATIINNLIELNKIELQTVGDKHDVVYRAKKELKIPTNVEPNEEAVYRLIAESATMGIWRRDIDHQIPIEKKDLTKLLNSLIKRSIIKKVGTSVKNRYMLAELQPDRSITGGAFYEGERFDKELVEGIREILKPHMRELMDKKIQEGTPMSVIFRSGSVTPSSAADWLNSKGFVNFVLTETDTRQILDALVLEGFADRKEDFYHAHFTDEPMTCSGLSFTPCGVCPLTEQCRPGGLVSPENCHYINDFLW